MRRTLLVLSALVLCGVFASSSLAAGGTVAFAGGTPKEQATVRSALNASSFDWNVIPATVTVHIGDYGGSYSTPGEIFLDGSLLDSGEYAWGVVQHEFGHQVDFFLLDDQKRAILESALGGQDWCYSVAGLAHSAYGCERFASELSWAYWQSPLNCMAPSQTAGESAGMPVAQFRALVAQLLAQPTTQTPAAGTKAYAPPADQATPAAASPKPKAAKKR